MGRIGAVLDEAEDEGQARWSLYRRTIEGIKGLMLLGKRVSGVSGGCS